MASKGEGFIQKTLRGLALLTVILVLFLVLRSCCGYCYGEFCEWLGKFFVTFDNEMRHFLGI